MTTSDDIEKSMQEAFAGIDKRKDELSTSVSDINKERDDYVNEQALKKVTATYLEKHYGFNPSGSMTMEEFVKKELTLDQKLQIIAEFNINQRLASGSNAIGAKFIDIAARKKDNKAQYKEEALELIEMYNKVLQENDARIALLRRDIAETKQRLEAAERKKQEIIAKDDETAVLGGMGGSSNGRFNKAQALTDINQNITDLKNRGEQLEGQLEDFIQVQQRMQAEFSKRKAEIDASLKKENIYIFRDAPEIDTGEEEEEKSGKDKDSESADTIELSTREQARSMFRDFKASSPERQRKLLAKNGAEDIIKMARLLGPIDRREFSRIMKQRLDELPQDSIEFGSGTSKQTVTRQDLSDMGRMDAAKLRAIRMEIDQFNADFPKKGVEEIEEFEEKLAYVRAGALIHESSGLFRGVRRFFERFSGKGTAIYEIDKSTADYATRKQKRTNAKEEWLDTFRVTLGRKKMDEYSHTSTPDLDRTGAGTFDVRGSGYSR